MLGCYDFLLVAKQYIEQRAQVEIHGPARAVRDRCSFLYKIRTESYPVIQRIDAVLNASGLGLPRKHFTRSFTPGTYEE